MKLIEFLSGLNHCILLLAGKGTIWSKSGKKEERLWESNGWLQQETGDFFAFYFTKNITFSLTKIYVRDGKMGGSSNGFGSKHLSKIIKFIWKISVLNMIIKTMVLQ